MTLATTNKKILLIGAGSSGQRFAALLKKLKQPVVFFRHRPDLILPKNYPTVDSLANLGQYRAAIISSNTSTHLFYLKKFVNHGLPTLVDKPIADSVADLSAIMRQARNQKLILQVGLNFRFLPIVQHIKQMLAKQTLGKIYHAEFYVGQYLPQWRPQKDYRYIYSANYAQGGGVALDLIHEIDLAYHFFPQLKLKVNYSARVSQLKIDTEDLVELQSTQPPLVTVKLDYLNQCRTRRYQIVGELGTIDCDIINHHFQLTKFDGSIKKLSAAKYFDVMKTYETELKHFLKLINTQTKVLISERSLAIDALKVALKARKYVPRT
jgi:hypothetical protein